MSLTDIINSELLTLLSNLNITTIPPVTVQLSKTPNFDFTFTIFQIAKNLNQQITLFSDQVVNEMSNSKIFVIVQCTVPGYIQLKINPHILSLYTISKYFSTNKQEKKDKILIEFSSPNTNKPQHLGHVRNNCLGMAISNILMYGGNDVKKIILVNDRGIHICKSMLAYHLYGFGETPTSTGTKSDHFVGKYYVLFEQKFVEEYDNWLLLNNDAFTKWSVNKKGSFSDFKTEYKDYYFNNISKLGLQTNEMLLGWESGDEEIRKLWLLMNKWTIDGFKQTYNDYGVSFDLWEFESDVYLYGKKIIEDAFADNKLIKVNDAISCDLVKIGVLKPNTGEQIIKSLIRSNGSTMYITQDVGTIFNRYKKYEFDKLIYVVANEQDRHFEILFKLTSYLDDRTEGKFYHLSYGMVNLPDGKMKSRTGTTVDADTLFVKLSIMAYNITKGKWPTLTVEELSYRSNKIALAAIKFYILSYGPASTVTFDQKKSLDFNGKSGPYILYQYARTQTILENNNNVPVYDDTVLKTLGTEEEVDLMKKIYWLDVGIEYAAKNYDPSKVLDSVYDIAKSFSQFYNSKDNHVLHCPDPILKEARLLLVLATGKAIKCGMDLCGIELLDKM